MAISASNSHSIGVLEACVIMLNIVLIFVVFRMGYREYFVLPCRCIRCGVISLLLCCCVSGVTSSTLCQHRQLEFYNCAPCTWLVHRGPTSLEWALSLKSVIYYIDMYRVYMYIICIYSISIRNIFSLLASPLHIHQNENQWCLAEYSRVRTLKLKLEHSELQNTPYICDGTLSLTETRHSP